MVPPAYLKFIARTVDLTSMDSDLMPNLLGGLVNLVALCIFIAGVMKVFQIATTLTEIKDALKDIQRNQDVAPPTVRAAAPSAATPRGQSGDDMLRALDAQLGLNATDDLAGARGDSRR
jgi:hypothetical protein